MHLPQICFLPRPGTGVGSLPRMGGLLEMGASPCWGDLGRLFPCSHVWWRCGGHCRCKVLLAETGGRWKGITCFFFSWFSNSCAQYLSKLSHYFLFFLFKSFSPMAAGNLVPLADLACIFSCFLSFFLLLFLVIIINLSDFDLEAKQKYPQTYSSKVAFNYMS